MNCNYWDSQTDYGSNPYVVNIGRIASQNPNFRTAIWTGCHLQMTVMCIPPCLPMYYLSRKYFVFG